MFFANTKCCLGANPNGNENPPFRKVGESEALDLKNRTTIPIKSTIRVHQKEY